MRTTFCVYVTGFLALIASPAVYADLSTVVFSITATNELGLSATYDVTEDMGAWDGDRFVWNSNEPVDLIATNGTRIAKLNPSALRADGSGLVAIQDPQINLNFAVQAGVSTTTFSIASALLTFPTLTSAVGNASSAFTATDVGGNGVTLSKLTANAGAYLAQYNGAVPSGTTFSEQIVSATAGAFGTATVSDTFPAIGDIPIPGSISDMSVLIRFSLTSLDLASGTSAFVVTPEPGSLLLLALGALALRRR